MYYSYIVNILLESSHFDQATELGNWVSQVELGMILRVRYDELYAYKILVTALEVLDHQIFIYLGFFSMESFRKNSHLRYVLHISEELE